MNGASCSPYRARKHIPNVQVRPSHSQSYFHLNFILQHSQASASAQSMEFGTLAKAAHGAQRSSHRVQQRLTWGCMALRFSVSKNPHCDLHGTERYVEAVREYITTPILLKTLPWPLYIRRREWLEQNRNGGSPSESYPEAVTFSELRVDKLADSTMTGSALGVIINVLRSASASYCHILCSNSIL